MTSCQKPHATRSSAYSTGLWHALLLLDSWAIHAGSLAHAGGSTGPRLNLMLRKNVRKAFQDINVAQPGSYWDSKARLRDLNFLSDSLFCYDLRLALLMPGTLEVRLSVLRTACAAALGPSQRLPAHSSPLHRLPLAQLTQD